MRALSTRHRRVLRLELLETRALMSATPLAAAVQPAAGAAVVQSSAVAPGDTVIPVHLQLGNSALQTALGVAAQISTIEQAVESYLNEIPGWHLAGYFDKTPTYSGKVDGSVTLGSNGMLVAANVTLSGSADIAASISGYYGISVLNVGVAAAADVSANVNATASFSVDTGTWAFSGAASLAGTVKGAASAMAWPVKGEVYIAGNVAASAAINAATGIASGCVTLSGSVGADVQLNSLFGGWTTIASTSRNLGSWHTSTTVNIGTLMESEVNSVVAAQHSVVVAAIPTSMVASSQTSTSHSSAAIGPSNITTLLAQGYSAA